MNPYIIQGGEQVYQQPFSSQNTLFYGMFLASDTAALQKNVCDRLFNDPMGEPGRFVPAGPFVLLAFCQLNKLFSDVEPYSQWGSFAEQEVAFWVLTIDTKCENIFYAFPYIWVDNAYALSMGREIYGFPKQLGRMVIPTDPKQASSFSLETLALATLSPETIGSWMQVLSATSGGEIALHREHSDAGSLIKECLDALHNLGSWKLDPELMFKILGDVATLTVPFVFLKQFRDVTDGNLACYQSVVETGFTLTKWHSGGLIDSTYQLTINEIGNLPIASDLGLAASPIQPVLSFWCQFDFAIAAGVEIWRQP